MKFSFSSNKIQQIALVYTHNCRSFGNAKIEWKSPFKLILKNKLLIQFYQISKDGASAVIEKKKCLKLASSLEKGNQCRFFRFFFFVKDNLTVHTKE